MEMITDIIPHMRCRNHILNVNDLIKLITDRPFLKVRLYCFVSIRCGQTIECLYHFFSGRSLDRNRWFMRVDIITDCGENGVETRMSLITKRKLLLKSLPIIKLEDWYIVFVLRCFVNYLIYIRVVRHCIVVWSLVKVGPNCLYVQ